MIVPLFVILAIPLITALAVCFLGRWPNWRDGFSIAAGAALTAAVASVLPSVSTGSGPAWTAGHIVPGIPIYFALEPLGALFAIVAGSLWMLTTLFAMGYLRAHDDPQQTRFFAFFSLSIFATMGLALAGNLFTLLLFYEVLTFSTFPLVTHDRTEQARRAGRIYLGILLTTSIGLLLPTVVWTWVLAGTLDFRDGGILSGRAHGLPLAILYGLFVFGAGKAAVMPFHRWLPSAMVAPTPVSALLHAVAVVKAGVFTILKVSIYIFGPATLSDAASWITWPAGFTIIAAAIIASRKDNLKARLAYSTISQLSYIVLAAALATRDSLMGGSLHIAMHAWGKITLFFCAGAIYVATHKTEVSSMHGLGRQLPFTFGAFFLGSIAIIGLPPGGGTWSKWLILLGAVDQRGWFPAIALTLSTLFSVIYLLSIPWRAFFTPPLEPGHSHIYDSDDPHERAPLLCVAPLIVTAAGSVALFFLAGPLIAWLTPAVGSFR